MSGAVLRQAAAAMRERAEAAMDSGPWEVYELPDPGPNRWRMTGVGVVGDDMGHRADVFLPVYAAHIASWHPAVALAVADWLDGVAVEMDRRPIKHTSRAFAVARAYLGDAALPPDHAYDSAAAMRAVADGDQALRTGGGL